MTPPFIKLCQAHFYQHIIYSDVIRKKIRSLKSMFISFQPTAVHQLILFVEPSFVRFLYTYFEPILRVCLKT